MINFKHVWCDDVASVCIDWLPDCIYCRATDTCIVAIRLNDSMPIFGKSDVFKCLCHTLRFSSSNLLFKWPKPSLSSIQSIF